jgi:hypothetical protein
LISTSIVHLCDLILLTGKYAGRCVANPQDSRHKPPQDIPKSFDPTKRLFPHSLEQLTNQHAQKEKQEEEWPLWV